MGIIRVTMVGATNSSRIVFLGYAALMASSRTLASPRVAATGRPTTKNTGGNAVFTLFTSFLPVLTHIYLLFTPPLLWEIRVRD